MFVVKIYIGNDHRGFLYKQAIVAHLAKGDYDVEDCGAPSEESCDYPDFAKAVAAKVAAANAAVPDSAVGILICGSGAGMAMAANKVHGIRAAQVSSEWLAEYVRRHNNANVITFGSNVTPLEDVLRFVDIFLSASFEGGRHRRRVEKISAIEMDADK
jgi:ribose 5-phosphate isomerase B